MNLKEFAEGLKNIRIEKKISLVDISSETHINIKHLEAIERGEFDFLPQTYIRAFLREYATILNLSPEDIIKQYELARTSTIKQPVQPELPKETETRKALPNLKIRERFSELTPIQRNAILSGFLAIIVVLVVIIANISDKGEQEKPKELSFDQIIKESEPLSTASPIITDTSKPQYHLMKKDSLRLEITTMDSVWISILIDKKKVNEHLFGPNRKWVWTAKESFLITMGNAGGATFKLNNKNLGTLGKPGTVIRNYIITEENLKN